MDPQEVLAAAQAGTAPAEWTLLPLRRDRVRQSALRWALLAVVGTAVFVAVLLITVPYNYTHGTTGAIITTFLLAVLAFVALGSVGISVTDWRRLARAGAYWIILTPDDFVMAEPGRLTQVPLENVAYITLRGVKTSNAGVDPSAAADPTYGYTRTGLVSRTPLAGFMGSGLRRQPKQPTTLAFLDTRTDTEVLVARDDSFGDLTSVEHLLQLAADAKQRSRRR